MLICLKTRKGTVHIVNWTTHRGLHYTLCNKSFTSKNNVETFAADNTFPGMCPKCYEIQELDNDATMEYDVRDMRTDHIFESALSLHKGIERGWDDVSEIYDDLATRYWAKKTRMRRKFPTEESKPKKKKRYKLSKSHGQSILVKYK